MNYEFESGKIYRIKNCLILVLLFELHLFGQQQKKVLFYFQQEIYVDSGNLKFKVVGKATPYDSAFQLVNNSERKCNFKNINMLFNSNKLLGYSEGIHVIFFDHYRFDVVTIKDSMFEGPRLFYDDDKYLYELNVVHQKLHGPVFQYDSTGFLIAKVNYKYGLLDSISTFYIGNNSIRLCYRNGYFIGKPKEYNLLSELPHFKKSIYPRLDDNQSAFFRKKSKRNFIPLYHINRHIWGYMPFEQFYGFKGRS